MKIIRTKTAVILCGGRGTRLGQLGKKIPKCPNKACKSHKTNSEVEIILVKNGFNLTQVCSECDAII